MIFKKIASIVLALVFTAIIIPCFTIKVAATNDTKAIIYDIDENTNDIIIAISNGSVAEESVITIKNTVLKLQIEGISEPVDVLLEGENHSDQVQSTADGEALFLNIPYGDYVIKIGEETSEPKANISIDETYYNGDPVYISITQDNLIENDEENADVAEENTSSKKIIVYVLVFINNAAFITFIVFLKKRNEH